MSDKHLPDLADLLIEKAGLKQDIYAATLKSFTILSKVAEETVFRLQQPVGQKDPRIRLIFDRKSDFEFQIHVGGDVLVFIMHTNVFQLDPKNPLWKTAYLKKAPLNSYCGLINVYNFLHDSVFYNRLSDIGYLIGRVLINVEQKCLTEYLANGLTIDKSFARNNFNDAQAAVVVENFIRIAIGFDMYLPPMDQVAELTVDELIQATQSQQFKTGKRLGFQFSIQEK